MNEKSNTISADIFRDAFMERDYRIWKKDKEIERLNNIINELEESLKYWLKLSEENKNMSNYTIYSNVLDILKNLKGGK